MSLECNDNLEQLLQQERWVESIATLEYERHGMNIQVALAAAHWGVIWKNNYTVEIRKRSATPVSADMIVQLLRACRHDAYELLELPCIPEHGARFGDVPLDGYVSSVFLRTYSTRREQITMANFVNQLL